MISNYVSLDLIIERLNTIQIPGQQWNISELKEWTWQALSKIGENTRFIETSTEVEIDNGKGILPSTLHDIHSVVEGENRLAMDLLDGYDEFHKMSYKINAGVIFTDFEKGTVIINGYYFPVDEDDKPLIPDDESFINAVYSFLRLKIGERLYWQNKISHGQYQLLEREWFYNCPQAKNTSKMLSEDGRHNFKKNNLKPFRSMYRSSRDNKTSITINTKKR